jgi:hypothetical protein
LSQKWKETMSQEAPNTVHVRQIEAMLAVLVKRAGGKLVITHAEMEAMKVRGLLELAISVDRNGERVLEIVPVEIDPTLTDADRYRLLQAQGLIDAHNAYRAD